MLTKYFRQKNVPYGIQASVRQYYAYILKNSPNQLQKHNQNDEEILKVIDTLGPNIKRSVHIVTHLQYIKRCKMLYENFSEEFLESLAVECFTKSYNTDEIITIPEWKESENNLYFIEKGQVELFVDSSKNDDKKLILAKFKKGECFGESPFFLDRE